MLSLNLTKGESLKLTLTKGGKFFVALSWKSDHDPDAHALAAHNDGTGAKVEKLEDILSAYNSQKAKKTNTLPMNPDGSFNIPGGGLHHSGDCRTGSEDANELITVDPSKLDLSVNEIPIFVTIHPPEKKYTFSVIKDCRIKITNEDGVDLGTYQLSDQFAKFNSVQMGSFVKNADQWEYFPVGVGFMGGFNDVLGKFS